MNDIVYTGFFFNNNDKENICFVGNAYSHQDVLNIAIQYISKLYINSNKSMAYEYKRIKKEISVNVNLEHRNTAQQNENTIEVYEISIQDKEKIFESDNFTITIIKNKIMHK